MKFGYSVICPQCSSEGFVSIRNVRSSYTPKRSKIIKSFKSTFYVFGTEYRTKKDYKMARIDQWEYWSNRIIRGQSKNDAYIKEVRGKGKENGPYKVYTRTYQHLYIGHYDRNEYGLKKINFYQGLLKSRPNGRKWCYVPKNSVISIPSTAYHAGFTINYEDLKEILSS